MVDYKKYINALRKCAKEHENDKTFTGHIIVSDLCRDTANLLEALERDPKSEYQQDHELLKAYLDGANDVLDKIRAEIFVTLLEECGNDETEIITAESEEK